MEIEFYSNRFSLYHLEQYFCFLTEGLGLQENVRNKVRLCFYEAVTNAVVHGNHFDESKKIYIAAQIEINKLVMTIRDEGQGFDLKRIPSPIETSNLEKPSGRGVFFVRESSEKCDYCSENKELRMEWTLV